MSMIDDPRTKPLQEWNRLARENAENAMVASMFEATLRASPVIETFSSWLLVATAAVASFLIANADGVMPLLSKSGFLVCGAFLCGSCLLGLLSKMLALRCRVSWETSSAVKQTFGAHLEDYKREEEKIKEGAAFWGINLETGIRIERVLKEFFAPLPKWVGWLAQRHFKKHAGNPQIGYLIQVKTLQAQGMACFLQALTFLGFLISGFIYAATT